MGAQPWAQPPQPDDVVDVLGPDAGPPRGLPRPGARKHVSGIRLVAGHFNNVEDHHRGGDMNAAGATALLTGGRRRAPAPNGNLDTFRTMLLEETDDLPHPGEVVLYDVSPQPTDDAEAAAANDVHDAEGLGPQPFATDVHLTAEKQKPLLVLVPSGPADSRWPPRAATPWTPPVSAATQWPPSWSAASQHWIPPLNAATPWTPHGSAATQWTPPASQWTPASSAAPHWTGAPWSAAWPAAPSMPFPQWASSEGGFQGGSVPWQPLDTLASAAVPQWASPAPSAPGDVSASTPSPAKAKRPGASKRPPKRPPKRPKPQSPGAPARTASRPPPRPPADLYIVPSADSAAAAVNLVPSDAVIMPGEKYQAQVKLETRSPDKSTALQLE